MLPVFVIIGRPNVGKSTLFNRLTKTRNAIVSDQPGVTRDRQYGSGEIENHRFIVVDTGGIAEPDDPIMSEMTEIQVKSALSEADVILFLVDALAGLSTGDYAIAKRLRHFSHKKIALVVNKAEREQADIANSEFYELGFAHLYTISANINRGIEKMMLDLMREYPASSSDDAALEDQSRTRIAILGRPNVGKSTLVNRLLGEDRVIVLDRPGTTRDCIAIPYDRHGKKYTLIDTAGIRQRNKMESAVETFSVIKAMQAMAKADVVILVLDARSGVIEQDLRLLGFILEAGVPFILAFNKWDHMDEYDRNEFKRNVDRRLVFADYARQYYISALHGTAVGELYAAIDEIQKAMSQDFETPLLVRILMQATEDHQPPLVSGRRIKLRYAHLGDRHPLTFVIHGKQVDSLPDSYKNYLVKYYRKTLQLTGVPIVTKWINDKNPFARKKNKDEAN
ncbi:MAG: hypothetical protein ACD_29C00028G0001 [uncultured bacterium]|nr:MAG: hypothetical protein ACD_29C00028G0001 [uncultured bacterium]